MTSLSQKAYLKSQLRMYTEKPYQCSQYKKAYARNSYHIMYMRRHNGEKPYQCSQCEKASQNNHLNVHMKTYRGETIQMQSM